MSAVYGTTPKLDENSNTVDVDTSHWGPKGQMSPVEEENWGRIEGEFAVKKKQKTTVIEGEIFSGGELEGKWRRKSPNRDFAPGTIVPGRLA